MEATYGKRNQIIRDGVAIAWEDTRSMHEDESGDPNLVGQFRIAISAAGASLGAVNNAYICARVLEELASRGDFMCPHSDALLRPIGLSPVGDVMLLVYRGDRKCDAVPVSAMAQLDPARYGKDPAVTKSVAWMRDVALAIRAYHEALCSGNPQAEARRAAIHTTVYGLVEA